MNKKTNDSINSNHLEEETFNSLIGNVLDSLEELKELQEDEDFQIIYNKNEISYEQFYRLFKLIEFIQDSISPFPIFSKEEYEQNGEKHIILKSSDEKGIIHTCFLMFTFIIDEDNYVIIPRTCGCREEKLFFLLPAVMSLDFSKIWFCIILNENTPSDFKARVNSLLKMYTKRNYVEAWTHIGFIAEKLTRQIYLRTYDDRTEDEVNSDNWNRLLKRLHNQTDDPIIEHVALLLDSLRPVRNEIIHHDSNPTSDDVEFGIICLLRLFKFYTQESE